MMMLKLMIPLVFALPSCGDQQPLSADKAHWVPVQHAATDEQQPPSKEEPAQEQPPQGEPAADDEDGDGEVVVPRDVPADAPQPQLPKEVNDLLDRLEASAADLRSFTADVRYEKEDAILGRKELRSGNIIYLRDELSGRKSFAILFDKVIVQNVGRSENKHFVFDGRWLAEIDHANKQFIKREIVPPGREVDPLKLGEGPFPLPVGQPKAEVLERFNVTTAQPPQEGLLKDLKEVEGLSLVPKPGAPEADDYAKIDLFYDRTTLLPVGINTQDVNGERKTVRLLNARRNPELTDDQKAKLDIMEPDPRQWRIDVRPWSQQQ